MAFCILAIILLLLPNKLIMKNKIRRIFIGTSGWVYNDWEKIFYPEDLRSKDKLKYFSEHFKTAEINYSFYHLPKPATYQNWYSKTPKDFVFAVKASRYISHIKRLKDVKEAWETFLKNALNLKEKLGPILLQLPPSFKYNSENLSRVKEFLAFATKIKNKRANLRLAIEVRHPSFKNPKFFDLSLLQTKFSLAKGNSFSLNLSPSAFGLNFIMGLTPIILAISLTRPCKVIKSSPQQLKTPDIFLSAKNTTNFATS